MNIHIPKIAVKHLSSTQREIYKTLDAQPYGISLAKKVASKLKITPGFTQGLYFSHRDYCGVGLFYLEGAFVMSTVYDGAWLEDRILSFEAQEEFIHWLANETDQSMALYGGKFDNQTMTQLRLEWYLEDDYSPNWNTFCQYARQKNSL